MQDLVEERGLLALNRRKKRFVGSNHRVGEGASLFEQRVQPATLQRRKVSGLEVSLRGHDLVVKMSERLKQPLALVEQFFQRLAGRELGFGAHPETLREDEQTFEDSVTALQKFA